MHVIERADETLKISGPLLIANMWSQVRIDRFVAHRLQLLIR